MSIIETELCAKPPASTSYRLRVTDVTGSLDFEAELQLTAGAGIVAETLAQRMELPSDVPWALRDDRGNYLDDERQIGEQVAADARVTLVPKTHLG